METSEPEKFNGRYAALSVAISWQDDRRSSSIRFPGKNSRYAPSFFALGFCFLVRAHLRLAANDNLRFAAAVMVLFARGDAALDRPGAASAALFAAHRLFVSAMILLRPSGLRCLLGWL